ncbi:MAG TPA: DUF4982 domain-containing protein [Chthoniobacteraceae bacterium]|nr:DUF4982 domain-containing protein [Chthoniobacteraceae bacterium]
MNNMLKSLPLLTLAAALCGSLLPTGTVRADYTPPASDHLDLNFDYDWKFIKGDSAGAEAPTTDDSSWSTVTLPHTFTDNKFRNWISTRNDKEKEDEDKIYIGKTWYRKHFTLDPSWAGRKVLVEFQGITRSANFYINGKAVGIYENGVAPCGIDITDGVKFGADNVLAVMVDNDDNYKTQEYGVAIPYGQPFNPNFGGINRDVVLHISGKVYQTLPLYRNLGTLGTYIYPTDVNPQAGSATIHIEPEVKNDSGAAVNATCTSTVLDADGNAVLTETSQPQSIAPGAVAVFKMTGNLAKARLWSDESPYLYKVYTTTSVDGKVADVHEITTGFRKTGFSADKGLTINDKQVYLKGYAPRTSMEWPAVGVPNDWLNETDFKMMREDNGNFCRPMHIGPRPIQVEAADKFGIVMVCPAANNEGDEKDPAKWHAICDIMRDLTIYYRNSPSVFFYEGCNQILSAEHMTDMKNIRLKWDPNGGRMAGLRSNDKDRTDDIREYGATMDNAGNSDKSPTWDAEYGRGEGPRRVWDDYTPMLNPRWDGKNPDPTPAKGTVGDTTHKYLLGGYFYIASNYHQGLGLKGGGDAIGEYMDPNNHAYFRLNSSEDMVLENLAKYWARYARSAIVKSPDVRKEAGVMVGGAKIIWSDSVTDGRMRDMEVTRTSGVVDGARLPKELYWAFQVAQAPEDKPGVYIVGHWNYPAGTVKRVYVVSNTPQVRLQTYDSGGKLLKDYGLGKTDFFPAYFSREGDQVNHYVFAFENVAWQPGSIKAIATDASGKQLAETEKKTVGAPAAIKITPILGPSGKWFADGNDIAMFDVEVVDAAGNRCPTYEDTINFTCSGDGIFLGGYNSGIRDSTNLDHKTSGYHLNVECGINRVFVRATRKGGTFTLNATSTAAGEPALKPGTASATSTDIVVNGGLSTQWPQKYPGPLAAK